MAQWHSPWTQIPRPEQDESKQSTENKNKTMTEFSTSNLFYSNCSSPKRLYQLNSGFATLSRCHLKPPMVIKTSTIIKILWEKKLLKSDNFSSWERLRSKDCLSPSNCAHYGAKLNNIKSESLFGPKNAHYFPQGKCFTGSNGYR